MTTRNKPTKAYMAIDQYGQTHHIGHCAHPRKALLDLLGGTNARKMYIDSAEGESRHCGYIINELWLVLYEVKPINT